MNFLGSLLLLFQNESPFENKNDNVNLDENCDEHGGETHFNSYE